MSSATTPANLSVAVNDAGNGGMGMPPMMPDPMRPFIADATAPLTTTRTVSVTVR